MASRNYPTFFPAVSHSITGHGKEEGYMSDINRLMRYRFQPLRHFVPPPLYFCIAKHPVALRGTAVEEGKYNPFHSLKIGSIPTKFLLSSNNRTLYSINKKIVSDYSINNLIRFLTYYDLPGLSNDRYFYILSASIGMYNTTNVNACLQIVKAHIRRITIDILHFHYSTVHIHQRYTR